MRTQIELIVKVGGGRYALYRELKYWLDSNKVRVIKVEDVDDECIAVFYEEII